MKNKLFYGGFFLLLLSLLCPVKEHIKTMHRPYQQANDVSQVETTEIQNGTFNIILKNVPTQVTSVSVPVWTEKKSQDDIQWYTATKVDATTYQATVHLANHHYENGRYFIHIYFTTNGDRRFVTSAEKEVQLSQGTLLAQLDGAEKQAQITLKDSDYQGTIRFAVWSAVGGQDDIHWYTANNYQATVPIQNHLSIGIYNVHTYLCLPSGETIFVAATNFEVKAPQGAITSSYVEESGQLQVHIANLSSEVVKVDVPLWSDTGGQDDILWHVAQKQADGTYQVTAHVGEQYFSRGNYTAHVYVTLTNGIRTCLGGVGIYVPETPLIKATLDERATTISVSYADAHLYRNASLVYAVWSEAKGQDDIHWYTAQADGNYQVALGNHLNANGVIDSGRYQIHLYAKDRNGKMYIVSATAISVQHPQVNVVEITEVQNGAFDVIIRNVTSNITQIQVPVWSGKNGQDDLVWYPAVRQANGTYQAHVPLRNHQYVSGSYAVHVYFTTKQNQKLFQGFSKQITLRKGTLEIQNHNEQDKNIQITLLDSDYGKEQLRFAVWSDVGGQDDIVWYQAEKNKQNGTVTVPIQKHHTAGNYSVHVYAYDAKGRAYFLTAGTFTIADINDFQAEIQNVESEQGTYQVVVQNIASKSGIHQVKVAVWSKDNQSDLYYYKATQDENGRYVATIRAENHQNNSGHYHTHVYVIAENGIQKVKILGDEEIKLKINYAVSSKGRGIYELMITQLPFSVSQILVPTWSDAGGQDDLVWYQAQKMGNGKFKAMIRSFPHAPYGAMTSHVYEIVNGKNTILGAVNYTIEGYQYMVDTYYRQKDDRWKDRAYGPSTLGKSGCVPTVLAMAYTTILNREITPVEVADYLYNSTNEFNRIFRGTSGLAIQYANNHYGISYKGLTTLSEVQQALQRGMIVLAAVKGPDFVEKLDVTHEILMYGYENGNTTVKDPDRQTNNKKFSVQYLYQTRSDSAIDLKGGYVFYALY